jgi:hypothetical protein
MPKADAWQGRKNAVVHGLRDKRGGEVDYRHRVNHQGRIAMNDTIVLTPPNDLPVAERVWMFVSRDKQGRENVCGSLMGELGIQPLMTDSPRVLKLMMPWARRLAAECAGTDRTIHLLSFSHREEIEGWR